MSRPRYLSRRSRSALPAIGVLLSAGFALSAVASVLTALAALLLVVAVLAAVAFGALIVTLAIAFAVPESRRPILRARERILTALR